MTAKPAKKAPKIQRRALHAPAERPTRQREAEAGSAYAAERVSKLSVDIPARLHIALKQFCVTNTISIRDWLIDRIKETTEGKR